MPPKRVRVRVLGPSPPKRVRVRVLGPLPPKRVRIRVSRGKAKHIMTQ